jgi:hypothetical protein
MGENFRTQHISLGKFRNSTFPSENFGTQHISFGKFPNTAHSLRKISERSTFPSENFGTQHIPFGKFPNTAHSLRKITFVIYLREVEKCVLNAENLENVQLSINMLQRVTKLSLTILSSIYLKMRLSSRVPDFCNCPPITITNLTHADTNILTQNNPIKDIKILFFTFLGHSDYHIYIYIIIFGTAKARFSSRHFQNYLNHQFFSK